MIRFGNNKWIKYFLNKYTIVGLLFVVWMTFFDQNSYYLHKEIDDDIIRLKEEKAYFENEISIESAQLEELKKNPFQYEKLAREKYLMKRENEDIFVIEKKDSVSYE
ncbi:MAG: FtsB family cell division protein [Weeksellaceae bacterium]